MFDIVNQMLNETEYHVDKKYNPLNPTKNRKYEERRLKNCLIFVSDESRKADYLSILSENAICGNPDIFFSKFLSILSNYY